MKWFGPRPWFGPRSWLGVSHITALAQDAQYVVAWSSTARQRPKRWPAKAPEEVRVATFDFSGELAIGETITEAIVSATLHRGRDANPAVLGSARALLAQQVQAEIRGGVHYADYVVRCGAATSSGRYLVLTAVLPVRHR